MTPPPLARLTTKTDAMRALLKAVAHGYTRWTGGVVAETKSQALALKFADRYDVDADAQTRWRRKARGEANARLILFAPRDARELTWWLLATPGSGLVAQMEALRPAGDPRHRVTVEGGYELVQTPRKGGPERWTWRMDKASVEAWEERIVTVIRSRSDDGVAQAIHSLVRVPGFHEVRQQAFALLELAEQEWTRSRAEGEPCPFESVFVPWIGRYRKPTTAPAAPRRRKKGEAPT